MSDVVDVIGDRFRSAGAAAYVGEPVTLREHMLQTAQAAEQDGAPVELVVAAFLHDYGHLIHGEREDAAEVGIDTAHEEVGFVFLEEHFPAAVVDPIRLHVAAKRYLCTVDPGYLDLLSQASLLSLRLQGGPMRGDEITLFEAEPHFESACRLRRYDDSAKNPDAETLPLEHYLLLLEAVVDG
jgi:phosphonate degradation associated HDIG domain protein